MNILLFADKQVGRSILNWISANYLKDIGLVVTTEKNDIYREAQLLKLDVLIFNEDSWEIIREKNFDIGILAWWPRIIKKSLINHPKYGFINFHPSLLPHCRGKHPNFWTLVEQKPYGVTIHMVEPEVDTGAIIAQRKIEYNWEDTGESLHIKAQSVIVQLFYDIYPDILNLLVKAKPQFQDNVSFHLASEMEEKSKISLNDTYKVKDLLNLIRARTFEGYPSCWFVGEDGEKYEVRINIRKRKLSNE